MNNIGIAIVSSVLSACGGGLITAGFTSNQVILGVSGTLIVCVSIALNIMNEG